MASSISLEYLQSVEGVANGLATLDGSGKITASQLPNTAFETFKGTFADQSALETAFPTGETADYAFLESTDSYWYWNEYISTGEWVNQETTATEYLALSTAERAGVPYIIVAV